MAANNTVVSFTLWCVDKASKALLTIGSVAGKVARGIWGLGANLGGWITAIQAAASSAASVVQGIFSRLWGSIQESFKFESFTVQFKTLLGSAEEAKRRMASLAEFAEVTPYNLEEVVKASRTLTVMSDGAMGTEYSLRLVGDAAAATGARFEEVAFWVGRAYAMIKGGQPFGEAALRLQELGILTPTVRKEMEALQASGAKNSEVWEAFAARLEEFGGAMQDLSQTGDGLTSTLEDTWTAAVREFGDAFQAAAKDSIASLIDLLGRLKADGTIKEWAQSAMEALEPVRNIITSLLGGDNGERASALKASWDYLKSVFNYGAKILIAAATEMGRKILDVVPFLVNAIGYITGAQWVIAKAYGISMEDVRDDTYKSWRELVGFSSFDKDMEEAGTELKAASANFSNTVKETAEAVKQRVKAEKEAAEAAAAQAAATTASATSPAKETDEQAKARIRADLDEADQSRLKEEKRIRNKIKKLEEVIVGFTRLRADVAKDAAELDKKILKLKEREADFHKRALDSDYDRQRRNEEKEKEREKNRERRLRKEARDLMSRFATISDPKAFLRSDFDVSKLGHRGRAIREWMLASMGLAASEKARKSNAELLESVDKNLKEINTTLKANQKSLDALLRQS